MRIVLLNFTGHKPNPVYDILETELCKRGHEVIVATLNDKRECSWRKNKRLFLTFDMSITAPSPVNRLPIISKLIVQAKKIRFIGRMRRMLGELHPDIVQVNTTMFPELIPPLMPASIRFTYDIRQINENVSEGLGTRLKEKITVYRMWLCGRFFYDYTFFCHRAAAEHILGEDWTRRSEVIPVAVDDHFLEFDDVVQAPRDDEPVKFIYVGTLSLLRNLDQIFAAARILQSENLNFQVAFIGPDYSNGLFQKAIDDLDVGSVVTIEAPVPYEQIPEVLSRAHVGLAYVPDRPTWHYQPTIKIKEYRALGLPILSTDVASHHEFLEDDVNGVMVADSSQSIADGMRRFIADRDFLRRSIQNAQSMRAGMTWAEVAAMYEASYIRLTGQNESLFSIGDVAS